MQRLALVGPDDPGLAAGDVLERQVGGVAGGRGREHVRRRRQRLGRLEQQIDAHPAEAGVELRPGRDAVDVAVVLRLRQLVHVLPRPGVRVFDQPVDGHRPRLGDEVRGHLGGQHRPVVADVVLAGWQPRVARRPVPAKEAACGSGHVPMRVRDYP